MKHGKNVKKETVKPVQPKSMIVQPLLNQSAKMSFSETLEKFNTLRSVANSWGFFKTKGFPELWVVPELELKSYRIPQKIHIVSLEKYGFNDTTMRITAPSLRGEIPDLMSTIYNTRKHAGLEFIKATTLTR
jgi:hypothetical protein